MNQSMPSISHGSEAPDEIEIWRTWVVDMPRASPRKHSSVDVTHQAILYTVFDRTGKLLQPG